MTGRPTIGLSLVLISPKEPERAQELRDWADFVHIRHIAEAAVPGYGMITPYENATGGDPRFMHFYEMDTDEPEAAFKAMTPLVMQRIGDETTDAFKHWAFGPSLRIMYVNTFARLGVAGADMTDFFDVVGKQRACRAFSNRPVRDDDIERILDRGNLRAERREQAAVGVRRRARRERRAQRSAISCGQRGRHADARSQTDRLSPELLADVDAGATGGIAAASVHIVVCADTERALEATIPSSIFPAVQNLLLAATALGLGSALTTIAVGYRAELQQLLALPDHVVPIAIVPIGHPARPLGPPGREPFANAHASRSLRRALVVDGHDRAALRRLTTGWRRAPASPRARRRTSVPERRW